MTGTPRDPPAATHGPPASLGDPPASSAPSALLRPEHVRALLALGRALSAAVEHADLARIAAEQVRASTGASSARFAELREVDDLAPSASARRAEAPGPRGDARGARAGALRLAPRAASPSAPARDVARHGAPVFVSSRAEARQRFRDAPLDALPGGEGGAWAFLPLLAGDQRGGVLTLVFDAPREFDPPTRAFLEELAAACANALARGSLFTGARRRADASDLALAASAALQERSERLVGERTHLFERERFARARAEAETVVAVRLADDLDRARQLTAALALGATEAEALAALVAHGREGFGALGVTVLRRGAGAALEVAASAGPSPDASSDGAPGDGPSAEAEVLASGAASWQEPGPLARSFPATARRLAAAGAGSWLGVPVRGAGGARGVLAVAFPRERAFTPDDRTRLTRLAEECAAALSDRAARDEGTPAPPGAKAGLAYVALYDAPGGPEAAVLGVFSSAAAAGSALRELRARRPEVGRAWITGWALDVAGERERLELDAAGPAP